MTDAPDSTRIHYLEKAYIDLLERVSVLERALQFETAQREYMEKVVASIALLPRRIDRLEQQEVQRRNGRKRQEAAE